MNITDDIMDRFATKFPGSIQLYSCATPNGIKVACALEELKDLRESFNDFSYEAHTLDIRTNPPESRAMLPFLDINPNGKIPALVDPQGKGGKVTVFESGACLLYLAEKYEELIPTHGPLRYDVMKWLFWGSTGVSSQFKRFGFYYHYCPHDLPYCLNRYTNECKRLLHVLDTQLASHGKHWIVGYLYSVADICVWPWVHALHENYGDAMELVFNKLHDYPHVKQWYARCMSRPAVKRSLLITKFL